MVTECTLIPNLYLAAILQNYARALQGFDFHDVKDYYFSKRKGVFYTFNHFYSEKSLNRAK